MVGVWLCMGAGGWGVCWVHSILWAWGVFPSCLEEVFHYHRRYDISRNDCMKGDGWSYGLELAEVHRPLGSEYTVVFFSEERICI